MGLALWLAASAGCTLLLWLMREALDSAHMALAYLVVVLLGSARHGRLVGLVLAVACFLAFNFFLLPPYYTLALRDPLDWTVLAAFLVTGAVAAELFHRVQRLESLREADRIKDAVLASVSHDLRTPLTTIRALASELRQDGDERAAIIEEEAMRLNRMVTDLLDLSSIRLRSVRVDLQLVAAEDLIGAALQRIGAAGGADRLDVRLPTDGSLPVGSIDFAHSLRVVVNLVENALRHTPPGEKVEVEVAERGSELVLRVLDRGPGVPEGDRSRIFEPFYQGPDRVGSVQGTGLGLAIALSLARVQGGDVEYHPRPGGGSIFELRLPGGRIPGS